MPYIWGDVYLLGIFVDKFRHLSTCVYLWVVFVSWETIAVRCLFLAYGSFKSFDYIPPHF